MEMIKKYELQYLYENNEVKHLKTWRRKFRSDNIQTLKIFVSSDVYRIVDSITKNVVWEHDSKEK